MLSMEIHLVISFLDDSPYEPNVDSQTPLVIICQPRDEFKCLHGEK